MLEVPESEIWRYLGYHGAVPSPEIRERIAVCLAKLEEAARPQSVERLFPLTREEDSNAGSQDALDPDGAAPLIRIGTMEIRSRSLAKNLRGCREVCVLAATLGHGPDRLLRRAEIESVVDAAVLQAAAAAMIEAWLDDITSRLAETAARRKMFLRPRFSPGYGDCPLSVQTDLLRLLDAQKRVGIALTDALMMLPTKSVTALIGITDRPEPDHIHGCGSCASIHCPYRRETADSG